MNTIPSACLKPLYDPTTINPAYHLHYSWSSWPSSGHFQNRCVEILDAIKPRWEEDGIRLLESKWTHEQIQLLFSAKPHVSPEFISQRAKGRLDHAMRQAGIVQPFSRKCGVRSIGDNDTTAVQAYIEKQVAAGQFADYQFESFMKKFTYANPSLDLSVPTSTMRGRYWNDLHIVLSTERCSRFTDRRTLELIRDQGLAITAKKGYAMSRMAVMPDHAHFAIRADPASCPNDVVASLQNNLAFALGQKHIWQDHFYVGTFGEYRIDAIRESGE